MSDAIPRILLLLLLGAWVSLDERVWPLFRLREPLVAATLAGVIVNQPWAGLAAGVVLQCCWLVIVPSGGALLPAFGLGGVVAGAVAGWGAALLGASGLWGNGRPLVLGLLFGLLAAEWGRRWEGLLRRRNEEREEDALASGIACRDRLISAQRGAAVDALVRGWIVTGFVLVAAGFLYRAILSTRGFAVSPVDLVGEKLPFAALAVGFGAAAFALRRAGRGWVELALGVGLGVVGGLLR